MCARICVSVDTPPQVNVTLKEAAAEGKGGSNVYTGIHECLHDGYNIRCNTLCYSES